MDIAMNFTLGLSQGIAWPWPIAVYLFLAGISGGAVAVALMLNRYRNQVAENTPVLKAATLVGFVTIVLGMICLVADLTNPLVFWLFIASGLSAGAAAAKLVAVGCFGEEEHSADMKLLHGAEWPIMAAEALCIFMIAVSLISGNAAAQAAVEAFVSGTWSTVFWVGVVGVGFVLPVLLNFVKSTASFYLAGLCSVVGMLCLRHFILYAGQIFGL